MSDLKADALHLRSIIESAGITVDDAAILERVAAQLDSDARDFEKSGALQDIGKSTYAGIVYMVAALECDYDRLEELRAEQQAFRDGEAEWSLEQAEELAELEEVAGGCKDREEANDRIQEDPLSVEVRGGWVAPSDGFQPTEFSILLGTGGPAMRIHGELDENNEPSRAWLEVQDWGTPWTQYIGADQDTLLTYCRCFYFGEG